MVTGVRYWESYCVGVVVTVPSLAAAALMTSSGAVALYLPYVDNTAAGPDFLNGLAMLWWMMKSLALGWSSIGEAAAKEKKAEAATKPSEKRMVNQVLAVLEAG